MTAAPLFDLTGKTALITGSSRGLGLAMARGLPEPVPGSLSTAWIGRGWSRERQT